MRRITTMSAVLLLTGAALLGTATQASARSGTGWDGTDPHATGCDSNASAITPSDMTKSIYIGDRYLGKLELRFSKIHSLGGVQLGCATAWARLTANHNCGSGNDPYDDNEPWLGCGKATIVRVGGSPARSYSCTIGEGKHRCWTKQVYDGPGFKAKATGWLPGWWNTHHRSATTDQY